MSIGYWLNNPINKTNISDEDWLYTINILKNGIMTKVEIDFIITGIYCLKNVRYLREFLEIYEIIYKDKAGHKSISEILHQFSKHYLSYYHLYYVPHLYSDNVEYKTSYYKKTKRVGECIEYIFEYSMTNKIFFDIEYIFSPYEMATKEWPSCYVNDIICCVTNSDTSVNHGLIMLQRLQNYADISRQKFPFSNFIFDVPLIEPVNIYNDLTNVNAIQSRAYLQIVKYIIKQMILRREKYDFKRFDKYRNNRDDINIGYLENFAQTCNYLYLTISMLYGSTFRSLQLAQPF